MYIGLDKNTESPTTGALPQNHDPLADKKGKFPSKKERERHRGTYNINDRFTYTYLNRCGFLSLCVVFIIVHHLSYFLRIFCPEFYATYDMYIMSRDSSVGIATGYGLDDQGEREFESR
jgi:hypothetical protein